MLMRSPRVTEYEGHNADAGVTVVGVSLRNAATAAAWVRAA
jgi:hypothetical protein